MRIVFNMYAVLQALIIAAIGALIYFTGFDRWIDSTSVASKTVHIISLYFIYWILSSMDKRGIKGQLFWFPTWFLCLAFIMCVNAWDYDGDAHKGFWWQAFTVFNYVFPIYLGYRMFKILDAIFIAKFREANSVLTHMPKTDEYFEANKKAFWAQVSHTFVFPSNAFLFFYPIYHFLYRNSITKKEFVAHYHLLLETLKGKAASERNQTTLAKFWKQLDESIKTNNYYHEFSSLQNLAYVINSEHDALPG